MSASPDESRRGRPVVALVLFLFAVFAGGALLAPWLYHAIQALAPGSKLARAPFGRVENRALLIAALVGIPVYVRAAGIRTWADVGVDPRRPRWSRFGAGFALGFGSLAAVCGIALAAGGRAFNTSRSPGQLAGQMLGALGTALLVALMEELLFRGAIFGGLRRAIRWVWALLISSAVYAIVHFMGRAATPAHVDWLSGFRALPSMLAGMTDPHALIPGLLSLTLAGVVLGLAYQQTRDLFASMGIHAGWIFWLKFYGFLTIGVPGANEWFWGSRKLVDGWMAFAALTVVLTIILLAARTRRVTA